MLFWCLVSWASGFSVFLSPVWKQSKYTLSMCTSQFSFSHPSNSPRLSLSLLSHRFHRMAQSPWELLHEKQMPRRLNGVQIRAGFKEVLNIKRFTQPHTHTQNRGPSVWHLRPWHFSLSFSLIPFTHSLHFPLSFSTNFWLTRHGHKATSYVHKSGWDSSPCAGMWGWVAFISLTFPYRIKPLGPQDLYVIYVSHSLGYSYALAGCK